MAAPYTAWTHEAQIPNASAVRTLSFHSFTIVYNREAAKAGHHRRNAQAGSIGTPRNRFSTIENRSPTQLVPHWTPSGGLLLRLSATSRQVKQTRLDNW